jgi:hypothetical protein
VFAPIINKVIADLFPEEIAINDWFINHFFSLFRGTVPFRVEAQVFLDATCSLEWCDFGVEIGLEEKWDAGICQERILKDRDKSTHDTLESCYGMSGQRTKPTQDSPIV